MKNRKNNKWIIVAGILVLVIVAIYLLGGFNFLSFVTINGGNAGSSQYIYFVTYLYNSSSQQTNFNMPAQVTLTGTYSTTCTSSYVPFNIGTSLSEVDFPYDKIHSPPISGKFIYGWSGGNVAVCEITVPSSYLNSNINEQISASGWSAYDYQNRYSNYYNIKIWIATQSMSSPLVITIPLWLNSTGSPIGVTTTSTTTTTIKPTTVSTTSISTSTTSTTSTTSVTTSTATTTIPNPCNPTTGVGCAPPPPSLLDKIIAALTTWTCNNLHIFC